MRSSIALAIACIAIGAGWLLVEPGSGGIAPRGPASGAAGPRGESRAAENAAVAPSPEPVPASAGTTVEATPFSEEADAAPADAGRGPRISVVDAATLEPVPGATIRFVAVQNPQLSAELAASRRSLAWLLEARGTAIAADENGEAWLPRYLGSAVAGAEAPARFGLATLGHPDDGPYRVLVRADRDLVVEVVDASGSPRAGIPVVLERRRLERRGRTRTDWLWRGATEGEDGTAVLRHLPWVLEGANPEPAKLAVTFGFPVPDAEGVELPEGPAPERVRLTLPATGWLKVVVEGAGEEGVPSDASVLVESRTRAKRGANPIPNLRVPLASRTTTVPVGLGLELAVTASHAAETLRPVSAVVTGPAREGETVTALLRFGDSHPRFVGRVIDEDGRPLAGRRIEGGLSLRKARLASTASATDETGRFAFVVVTEKESDPLPRPQGGEGPALVLTAAAREGELPDPNGPTAKVPLTAPLAAGDNELGDVTLVLPPLVLAGVVVDEQDQPVPHLKVGIEQAQPAKGRNAPPGWGRLWNLGARTADDGSFEVRGACARERPVRAAVEADRWFESERASVAAGATGVRVVLSRAGIVEGSALLPPNLPPERIQVVVQGPPAATPDSSPLANERAKAQVAQALDRDGRFRFARLRPGTAQVHFRVAQPGLALLTVPDVIVESGEESEDPRLAAVDLRERVRAYELTVTDAAAQPVEGAEIEVGSGLRGGRAATLSTSAAGRALLVTTEPACDLVVRASGCRDQHVHDVDGARTIVLQPAIPVRLVLTGDWRTPQAPYELSVMIVPGAQKGGGKGKNQRTSTSVVDAARDAVFAVSEPGLHRVAVSLLRRADGKQKGKTVPGIEPDLIDVIDSPAEQVFQVRIPADRLVAAYEALR